MQILHLAISLLLSLIAAEGFIIIPSNTTSCPTGMVEHCVTLTEFQEHYASTLNTNAVTTLKFLPGVYQLHSNLVVRSTSTLIMHPLETEDSFSSIAINCTQSSSLVFEEMAVLRFTHMNITNCGRSDKASIDAAVILNDVRQVELHQTVVLNSRSSAINATNSTSLVLNNTIISGSNRCGLGLNETSTTIGHSEENAISGSAIIIKNSSLYLMGENYFSNNIAIDGGAILALNSSLSANGTTHFINNTATGNGGAICSRDSSITIAGQSEFIYNCATKIGGAIFANSSSRENNVIVSGRSNWRFNTAQSHGGAMWMDYMSVVCISGTISFTDNTITSHKGGAVTVWHTNNVSFNGNITFANNSISKTGGGGALDVEKCTAVDISGTVTFQYNQGNLYGGAMEIVDVHNVSIYGEIQMSGNTAKYGGAFFALRVKMLIMIGNITFNRGNKGNVGGALYARDIYEKLFINGSVGFTDNSVIGVGSGGAVWLQNVTNIQVYGSAYFCNNRAYFGGAIAALNVKRFKLSGDSLFKDNTAQQGFGGAIFTQSSTLEIFGHLTAQNNSAKNGGGLCLTKSMCHLKPNVRVSIIKNKASMLGGGTFIDYGGYISSCVTQEQDQWIPRPLCTFQFRDNENISIEFVNNTAGSAGSAIYGGDIDECSNASISGTRFFDKMNFSSILHIVSDDSSVANISSSAQQVCTCKSTQKCHETSITRHVYPGETIQLFIVAVGQRNGTVPAVITASFDEKFASIHSHQRVQNATSCTKLNYTIFSKKVNATARLTLKTDGQCAPTQRNFTIIVILRECPEGFTLSTNNSKCSCNEKLSKYTNTCNINNQKILRDEKAKFWVGYYSGLILSPYCPYDYCKFGQSIHFRLNDTDEQCNFNRTGTLCGMCKSNYSLLLGSSACKENCSNWYLFLIVAFAVAGVVLVAFIFALRLTVAVGTINGLVFYANVVHIHENLFFPPDPPKWDPHIQRVFIALLNLDLGIATCFYKGMDMYQRTWLQFVFPVYIWAICALIIFLSSKSCRLSKLLGNNPVAVLSTLLLLSYNKILTTITDAVTFTTLDGPNGSTQVWIHNACISTAKHAPLMIFSMLVFLILFPYTLLLLANQWLRAWSNRRACRWMNSPRLISFLDTYTAPFKPRYYYWSGVLLLARIVMRASIAGNIPGNQALQLLVIIVVVTLLIGWQSVCGNPYRRKMLGALEVSFLLNLIFLSAVTYYSNSNDSPDSTTAFAALHVSTSFALMTFIVIVIYHAYLQLKDLCPLLWSHDCCCSLRCCRKGSEGEGEINSLSTDLSTKRFYRESLLSEVTH